MEHRHLKQRYEIFCMLVLHKLKTRGKYLYVWSHFMGKECWILRCTRNFIIFYVFIGNLFTFFYDKLKKCTPYWLHRNSLVQTKCQSPPPLHYMFCGSWHLTDVISWRSSRFNLISKNLDRNGFPEKSVFT